MSGPILRPLLAIIENCREAWRPRIQGTALYRVLQLPSRLLRRVLPDYRSTAKDGIFHSEAELWMCSLLPSKILDWIVQNLQPRSVLDLGCGTGQSLNYFLAHGVDAVGVEGSKLAISRARNPRHIVRWNLERELRLGRRFDLVFSYEVVEHVHPDFVDNLVRSFANHADLVVLTAAHPGQGGEGHFNEQPAEYWVGQFGKHGYELDEQMTADIQAIEEQYAENALVFRRKQPINTSRNQ